ncbi:MAG: CPBP family glutamic-type intramembrane protease, partial [Stackebrandtia sp.]
GSTLWSSMAIAIEAGVLLGVAYLWRRNIWFVVGLHFTWNTVQSLLGIPTSGHDPHGLMSVEAHGPALWSGGDFGLEASVVPILVSLAIIIPMFVRARRNDRLVPMRRSRR